MNILHDEEKLIRTFTDFNHATGVNNLLVKSDFTPYSCQLSQNGYCEVIQSTPEGLEGCRCSDRMLLKNAQIPEPRKCMSVMQD